MGLVSCVYYVYQHSMGWGWMDGCMGDWTMSLLTAHLYTRTGCLVHQIRYDFHWRSAPWWVSKAIIEVKTLNELSIYLASYIETRFHSKGSIYLLTWVCWTWQADDTSFWTNEWTYRRFTLTTRSFGILWLFHPYHPLLKILEIAIEEKAPTEKLASPMCSVTRSFRS